jgi:XTP/dITP diphosphohydrolase
MPSLVLATANRHKVAELTALLRGVELEVISASEAGFVDDIEETGTTLEANALLKARSVHAATRLPCLADDTGLEVDALGGAPGVYSARFAGEHCSFEDNKRLLLERLHDVPPSTRTARFRCVVALVGMEEEQLFEGRVDGVITTEERGTGGFGYDAIFQPMESLHTFAEMSAKEKNSISHRGRALEKVAAYLMRA